MADMVASFLSHFSLFASLSPLTYHVGRRDKTSIIASIEVHTDATNAWHCEGVELFLHIQKKAQKEGSDLTRI